MQKYKDVYELVGLLHKFHDGIVNLEKTRIKVYGVFQKYEERGLDEKEFFQIFPIFLDYFFDPAKKCQTILQKDKVSREVLLKSHSFIRQSKLAKTMFLSNHYPRSLLVKSAVNLLGFMNKNQTYLSRILTKEMVGPMMLEIHPTNAMCIYKCQMCIWCGGLKQAQSIADYYGSDHLLETGQWREILEEAKGLGTGQIIFSGGGETLLAQAKVKEVLDKANSLDLETMIYTNGRMLNEIGQDLLDSILNSSWLRISLHAATPEIYSRLVNRPLGANDLEHVIMGVRKIMELKSKARAKLKVGFGVVLQEANFGEMRKIVSLCSDLEIDFLDIRVDCIGATEALTAYQLEQMHGDLRDLRSDIEKGAIKFSVTFADDLLIAMDQWKNLELTKPKRCLIPTVRPAIDPFGVVGACDSIGEPYTRSKSPREYVLGRISSDCSFSDIMRTASSRQLGVKCNYCMPGQISLNALLEKLVDDLKHGIKPDEQPFCF